MTTLTADDWGDLDEVEEDLSCWADGECCWPWPVVEIDITTSRP